MDDFGQVQPSVPPKYFLTFQGIRNQGLEGASYVRGNLEATLNASLNAPTAVRLPGGQQRPVENITRLPNDVYIAIANKAQRHKELRPVRAGWLKKSARGIAQKKPAKLPLILEL